MLSVRGRALQGEASGGPNAPARAGQCSSDPHPPPNDAVDPEPWTTSADCTAILQVAVDSLGAEVGVLSLCNQRQSNGSILASVGRLDLLPVNVAALPGSGLIRNGQPMLFSTPDADTACHDALTWIVIPLLVEHGSPEAVILLGQRGELHVNVSHASLSALGRVCTLALTNSLGQRAAALFDGLPEAAVVTDVAGRIRLLNRRAEHVFGFGRAEVAGEPIEVLIPKRAAAGFTMGRRQNGSLFSAAVSLAVVSVDGDLELAHVIRDVSDEDDRLSKQEEFFLDVAHELRTPAATIKTSAEVLTDLPAERLPVDSRQLLRNIEREADRIGTLINDLLDLNSIRGGRVQLHPVRLDLRQVAVRAADIIEPLARSGKQIVSVILPPTPVWAVSDPELLGRAILNLVSNAQKYGKRGGCLEVRLDGSATEAGFTITDDGPGIPEADLEAVFQRFYRSPTPHGRRIQGSGLGLPVCRAAIELLGGRVWAERGVTVGSVFKVVVPADAGPSST